MSSQHDLIAKINEIEQIIFQLESAIVQNSVPQPILQLLMAAKSRTFDVKKELGLIENK